MNQTATLSQIQTAMEATITRVLGVTVEATCRGSDAWTISGQPAAVESAVAFLGKHRLMTETGREFDAELGELFVYLKGGK